MDKEIILAIASVVSAIIAAVCATRIAHINYMDKIYRSVWVFEQYLYYLSAYNANPTKENLAQYKAFFALFHLYSDELLENANEIDGLISRGMYDTATKKTFELIESYVEIYNMKKFYNRKRLRMEALRMLFAKNHPTPEPPPSVPEGATGPNGGNQGPDDCYGFDEKD